MNVAGLKGPTGLGMLKMMEDSDTAESTPYTFTLAGAADEVVSKITTGELDIASVPSNLAATLWNKTNGGVQVLGINALGVLYLVTKGETVNSLADLKGKTIISSGKGTTAQYTVEYLLKANGIDPETDVTIDYKAEHADAATAVASAETAIAVLPQPFVTTVTMQERRRFHRSGSVRGMGEYHRREAAHGRDYRPYRVRERESRSCQRLP